MSLFFLGYRLPPAFEQYRQKVRSRLLNELGIHPEGGRTEAHVTVKHPVELLDNHGSKIPGRIANMLVTKGIKSLRARIRPPSSFPGGVVYLPVECTELSAMMLYIIRNLGFEATELEGQNPHITLARIRAKDAKCDEHTCLAEGYAREIDLPAREIELNTLVWWKKTTRGNEPIGEVNLNYSGLVTT